MPPESSKRRDVASSPGLIAGVRIDLARLHAAWMGVLFPRQRRPRHPSLGRWRPETLGETVGYAVWGVVGSVVILLAYPLAVVGFAVRGYAGSLRRAAAAMGLFGVVAATAVVWGALIGVAYVGAFTSAGVDAVAVGGGVATVSAGVAVLSARVDGRATTLLVAYPFAVTALFLPPVVAAFYSPTLAAVVFPNSELLAIWILDNLLGVGGIASYLRETFALVGFGYVGMWFGLAFPVGWFLGVLVTLANLTRPADGPVSV